MTFLKSADSKADQNCFLGGLLTHKTEKNFKGYGIKENI